MLKRCATCKFGQMEYIHNFNARFPHLQNSIIACSILIGNECAHKGYLSWEPSEEILNRWARSLGDLIDEDELKI